MDSAGQSDRIDVVGAFRPVTFTRHREVERGPANFGAQLGGQLGREVEDCGQRHRQAVEGCLGTNGVPDVEDAAANGERLGDGGRCFVAN